MVYFLTISPDHYKENSFVEENMKAMYNLKAKIKATLTRFENCAFMMKKFFQKNLTSLY